MFVQMPRALSIYLDLLRFFSALTVMFFHANYPRFDGEWLYHFKIYGHDAVIVFFVLSGFVIAYTANHKDCNLRTYATHRLGRLYSVAFPALILTLILDFFGKQFNMDMYTGPQYQSSEPILRFLSNLFYVNEIWFESWRAFSNGPYWSISYEFWYYVIFASYFYFSGFIRWSLVGISMFICGPKILLLFPVWLAGVAAFYACKKVRLTIPFAYFLVIFTVLLYMLYKFNAVEISLIKTAQHYLGKDFLHNELHWSRRFLSDYILGAIFFFHILAMHTICRSFSFNSYFEKAVKYAAGVSFAIYLLHYPLLQFYGSLMFNGKIVVGLTLVTIFLLAPITEGSKKVWINFFKKIFSLFSLVIRPKNQLSL